MQKDRECDNDNKKLCIHRMMMMKYLFLLAIIYNEKNKTHKAEWWKKKFNKIALFRPTTIKIMIISNMVASQQFN